MKSPEEETCLDTTEKYKLDAVSDKQCANYRQPGTKNMIK